MTFILATLVNIEVHLWLLLLHVAKILVEL